MIIDAMDLLYTNRFDGFALVSSDSDFTALAIRIKEQGATVYGFGKMQTPDAFKNACSHFTYVENLSDEEVATIPQPIKQQKNTQTVTKETTKIESKTITTSHSNTELPLSTIQQVFDNQDAECITVASLGSQLKLMKTDFDPRTYGFKRLNDLIKGFPQIFECDERTLENGHKHLYVKLK